MPNGLVGGRDGEGLCSGRGTSDLVVTGTQVDGECPEELQFVVDDKDAGQRAASSRSRRPVRSG